MSFFNHFARDESGASAIEYAVVAAVVCVGIVVALQNMGSELNNSLQSSANQLQSANAE